MIVGTLSIPNTMTSVSTSGTEREDLKLIICNSVGTDNNFFLNISNSKTGLTSILYFNFPILAFDTFVVPFTVTLASGDVVSAKALNAGLTLSLLK